MKILVLGSGAGGGFPQWQCHCRLCGGLRNGHARGAARTQSALAISTNGQQWILLNASRDLGQQLREQHQLHHTPIHAVVLMDAQVDHVTGLLSLREGPPIKLYATPSVFEDLTTGLPILPVLEHYCGVQWHMLPVAGDTQHTPFQIGGCEDLQFEAVAIPGQAPRYSPKHHDPSVGDNIALHVRDRRTGQRLFYAPGLAQAGPDAAEWLHDADCVIVDGRQSSPSMIDVLSSTPARRKVLTHIHHNNPILDGHSHERRELEAHGIEVAYDGMEIQL